MASFLTINLFYLILIWVGFIGVRFGEGKLAPLPLPPPTFASPPTRLKLDRIMLKTFHYILQKEPFTLVESNSNNTLSIEEYLKKLNQI